MANVKSNIDSYAGPAQPAIRKISPDDLKDVLIKGWSDFIEMPTFAIFLVVIYPIVGLVLFSITFNYNMLPLVFPLMAGFALLGPVAAVGLYDLSRRREQGKDVSIHLFGFFQSPSAGSILVMAAILLAIFLAWLGTAQGIYNAIFGSPVQPPSIEEFVTQVLTTSSGWTLIIVGCGVGFFFALFTFSISVVSFPMLVDRDVGVPTAILTSIRAVIANPGTMAVWGFIVAFGLLIGALPAFIGLIVVLPVLGHSTWHLYRKVVAH